jgi:hypothetical protein
MFKDNKTFYPTPKKMIERMAKLINGTPKKILEPSAGKGDLVEGIQEASVYHKGHYCGQKFRHVDFSAIEVNKDLRATLRGKRIKVIDTDFLTYSGPDKYDLIIANPPFDDGDKHLLKAINIMYRGQIIFLLNAETLRNPHTNTRKELVGKLKELKANVKYYKGAFKNAERPTGVEVALIDITIERNIEDDLFDGADDTAHKARPRIENNHEIVTGKAVEDLVVEYNEIITIGTETIISYYRNYRKVCKYIGLNKEADRHDHSGKDMTEKMQNQLNDMITAVRVDFWRRTLDLKEVTARLTSKKQDEFEHALKERADMDFTENNIRAFILNIIGSYEKTIMDSVLEIFDRFTIKHCYRDTVHEKNIHYFNGWKTNDAFKVNKKVIMPIYGSFGGAFRNWSGGWDLDYKAAQELRDIDLVANYFDGMDGYLSMTDAIKAAFAKGQSRKIRSTYFTIHCYQKGTIHLTFNDMDILRRFNVTACKGKGWLPEDYAAKSYKELSCEERETVDTFEGKASYAKNINRVLIPASKRLQIAA